MMQHVSNHNLLLFDLDGTLVQSRQRAKPEIVDLLRCLKRQAVVAIVSGTDYPQIVEQLFGSHVDDEKVFEVVDYIFSENGTVSRCCVPHLFDDNEYQLQNALGEEQYQVLINFLLRYIADLELPKKRGTFIELRSGVLNVSPIGRNCSYEERQWFSNYDAAHHIRQNLIYALKEKFAHLQLLFAIGGQISIDIYLTGWDKRLCLKRMEERNIAFSCIHFFGDRTSEGGNDYTIYNDHRVIGHSVQSPDDTIQILKTMGFALDKADVLYQF